MINIENKIQILNDLSDSDLTSLFDKYVVEEQDIEEDTEEGLIEDFDIIISDSNTIISDEIKKLWGEGKDFQFKKVRFWNYEFGYNLDAICYNLLK